MAKQRMIQSFTALICSLTLMPLGAFGWSAEAHRAIAIVASNRLKGSKTVTRISEILGSLSLQDIAVCPDEIRELEKHEINVLSPPCEQIFPDHPTGTASWHFIDTPIKTATFTPTAADVKAACGPSGCVTVQIKHFLDVLSKAKDTDTGAKKIADQQALSFVVHFIGDIHQPLHAAERDGDAGGNAEHLKFFNADKLVLHGIWDNQIVARIEKTPEDLVSGLKSEITTANAEPTIMQVDWAIQSYVLARDVAYKGVPPAPKDPQHKDDDVATLGQPYQDAAAPVVRKQIARAGVRLASALQSVLQ
jgi:hypothetical protein